MTGRRNRRCMQGIDCKNDAADPSEQGENKDMVCQKTWSRGPGGLTWKAERWCPHWGRFGRRSHYW